ncbi:hypothetical protein [Paenibacillus sp. N3.4]|uniref:hypothetical protein n=1 Tax=Paenibacillus sp. N3.4 TaxID=2603222 RepID=UPI0011C9A991|nr:hypothetical protein [Paenibacillus sp. N3.4]TXK85582.1 hypothetical protein FU659_03255 [Paenibacillus sp. N3.4]
MKKWILLIAAALIIPSAFAEKAEASVSNFQVKYDEGKKTLFFSWEGETSKRFKLFAYPISKGFSTYGYHTKKTSGSMGFNPPQLGDYEAFVQDDEGKQSSIISYSVNKDGTVVIK